MGINENRKWAGVRELFYLTFPMIGLLVLSIWNLLECGKSVYCYDNGGLNIYQVMAINQGIFGVLALALAWSIARFSLHKYIFKYWYVFPVVLVVLLILTPFIDHLDIGRRIIAGNIYSSSITGMYYVSLAVALVFLASRLRSGVTRAVLLLCVF